MKGHVTFAKTWFVLGLIVATVAAANDAPDRARSNRKSQLATGRIKCRYVSKPSKAGLSADQVAAIFQKHDLSENPEEFEAAIRALIPLFPQNKPMTWGLELSFKPGSAREEITAGRARLVTVRSGETEIRSNGFSDKTKQSDVYLYPAGTTHYRMMDLRHFELAEKKHSGGVAETGASQEVRQYLTTEYAGGRTLPRITVRTRYVDGRLRLIQATYIESAEFGMDLPDSVFRVSADRGVHLFDCRRPRDENGRPFSIPLTHETHDVVETADNYVPRAAGFQPF